MSYILNEDSRNDLLQRSKTGKPEKTDGKTRYQKRVKSKIVNSVQSYNSINMDKLFKEDIVTLDVPVVGETDSYHVKISFGDFLAKLQKNLNKKQTDTLELKDVIRSLLESFNGDNVYIYCTCLHPDTEIKLLDNKVLSVEQLEKLFNEGQKLYVYSVDENGDFKPGEVEKVWKTGSSEQFVEVTLDNDQIIKTTPDHLFMMRFNAIFQTQNLIIIRYKIYTDSCSVNPFVCNPC